MKKLVLLGAGASVEAGIPDSYRMTAEIVKQFNRRNDIDKVSANILNFVAGGLLMRAGEIGQDPFSNGVNVEELFSAVELLGQRQDLEISPFVYSWHPLINAFDREESSGRDKVESFFQHWKDYMERNLERFDRGYGIASTRRLEELLRDAIDSVNQKPGSGAVFHKTANLMMLTLASLVWINEPSAIHYLTPIVRFPPGEDRVVIATLNYDNTIELAAAELGLPCNTGIDAWSEKGNFDFSNDGLHLIKLHGSIDWKKLEGQRTAERPMPHTVISRTESMDEFLDGIGFVSGYTNIKPAVIFGQRNKLTADGPFLDLLRAFQEELGKCDHLTVIGYSFRDEHINTFISQWLNASSSHRISIVDPGFSEIQGTFSSRLRNITRTDSGRLEVNKLRASDGIKVLFDNEVR